MDKDIKQDFFNQQNERFNQDTQEILILFVFETINIVMKRIEELGFGRMSIEDFLNVNPQGYEQTISAQILQLQGDIKELRKIIEVCWLPNTKEAQ